ncbi:hypothetical protein M405DRAFT_825797 [Rhizopogon salebrosus TDB-379]|nr:hypothetical protein M405DRAFT_825797 [Rhizopogon salebrosus TDB-379]
MATFAYKAHAAARSSAGRQVENNSAHFQKQVEEHVAPTFYPPVLARVYAHKLIHSPGNVSSTAAPLHASVQNKEHSMVGDPLVPNMFAGQGAYRARTYLKYGTS